MTVAAALLSIALFLVFGSAGAQKLSFNPAMSKAAGHMGFSKRAYQRIGLLEVLGGLALLVSCVAHGSSFLAILNEVAAGCLVVLMALAVVFHVRKGDAVKFFAPALVIGLLTLLELIFRLPG
ncbi:MAG TPA: DoxX family protein [Acidimicrobiales bacterium]